MTKQINLNDHHLLPGYGPVQLPVFLLTLLAAIVVAAAWVFLAWQERQNYLAEEQRWLVQLDTAVENLNSFRERYPNVSNESELLQENQDLTSQLSRARETYSGLANQVENAIEGFHAPLVQLTEYDLDGLWLERILLKDGQRYFALRGVARAPELVPNYIEQLGQSSFQGLNVDYMAIAKDATTPTWRFVLSNEPSETSALVQGGKR